MALSTLSMVVLPRYVAAVLCVLLALVLLRISPKRLLLAAVFLAPLDIYRVDMGLTSISLFRLLVLTCAVGWLVRTYVSSRLKVAISVSMLVLVGANGLSLAGALVGSCLDAGVLSTVLNTGFGLLIVMLSYVLLRDYNDWAALVKAFLASGVWFVVFAVYTYGFYLLSGQVPNDIPLRSVIPFELAPAGWLAQGHNALGVPRLTLPFESPPHLSGVLAAMLCLTIVLYLLAQVRVFTRCCLFVYTVGLSLCLLLTLSRTGWLAALGGLAVVVFYAIRVQPAPQRRVVCYRFLALAVTGVAVLLAFVPRSMWQVVAVRIGSLHSQSLVGHEQTRLAALEIWATNLKTMLAGVGLGNYRAITGEYYSLSPYTTVLSERGVMGSVLYWLLYYGASYGLFRRISTMRSLIRTDRAMYIGVLAATVAVLFGSFFYEFIQNPMVWILFGLASAAMYLPSKGEDASASFGGAEASVVSGCGAAQEE